MKSTLTQDRKGTSFPRHFPRNLRRQTLIFLFVAAVLAAICFASGCATTEGGIEREARIYALATNVVAHAQQIAPSLPAPVNTLAEAVLGAITLGLGAWNTLQHKQIKKLKNGANGAGASSGNAPPAGGA
jgi:hypothetical protein